MSFTQTRFGVLPDGKEVILYEMQNGTGCAVSIINFGGAIQSLKVPDNQGKPVDVVLGFPNFESYLDKSINPYFGCLIGRYANRICAGKIPLSSGVHIASVNEIAHDNTLHGGFEGFDKKLWTCSQFGMDEKKESITLTLEYVSPDGEEGFPGTLSSTAIYSLLLNKNEIKINYKATTDKETVCNLTNHTYFNLSGSGKILDHNCLITAPEFIPVDPKFIPTGEIQSVENTPFDFRVPRTFGESIADYSDAQIKIGPGYDHSYYWRNQVPEEVCVKITSPKTKIVMEIQTTQIGLQLYTGNHLPKNSGCGKNSDSYGVHSGFAVETQSLPDSINRPNFPKVTLKPGEVYNEWASFNFTVSG